jgi:hypothetical protein
MIYDSWDKKRLECEFLYSFRSLFSHFPQGRIECERESPDFIIHTITRRIGIEITRIYIDSSERKNSLQSLEATKTRVTDLSKEIFEKGSETRTGSVTLFFNLTRPLRRYEEKNIAGAVSETIRRNFPPMGEAVELECHPSSVQPAEVDLILVNRVYPYYRWDWTEAGIVQKDAVAHIQSAINDKAQRIETYLTSCDECWLLIVAPSMRPSGKIHPDRDSLENTYVSPFAKTYYLNFGRGAVACLKTVPAQR